MPQILPQNAPFTPQQRAWLDGFLSATLGFTPPTGLPARNGHQNGNGAAPTTIPAAAIPVAAPAKIEAVKPSILYTRDDPFPARVIEVRALNGQESAKDVRFINIDLSGSGLSYEAGDALGIYPENNHELVEDILEALGATGEEPVVTPESRIVPARIALQKGYEITRVSENLLLLLAETARDDEETKRLLELADEDSQNWLDGRDVLDVLLAFQSSNASLSDVIAALSPLQPRLYSIASSQKANPTQVHLTVGIVRYHANDRHRHGVASTFLADRAALSAGQKVSVFVHPSPGFRPPENGDLPMIMVGPGTGVAPFRAFLQERSATSAKGNNWLFFGDQKASCDFLYREELENYEKEGVLTHLSLAFSRDQTEKIYVQTRMLEEGEKLWQWLEEGAHFYICGDAKRMAKDVDSALHQIAREHGKMDEAGAKAFVQSLVKSKRYQRDVY